MQPVMPTPRIIEIPEDQGVVCPICKAVIVDAEDGLVEQPSCPHIRFVYANECFEWAEPGLEEQLIAEEEEADQNDAVWEIWDALRAHCDKKDDLILEQVSEGMACGPVSFKVWIGIRGETESSKSRHCPIRTFSDEEYSPTDRRVFFRPTKQFLRFMNSHHSEKHVYEAGCGVAKVSALLSKAGMHVTAIDRVERTESECPVVTADSTTFQYEKGSVVLLCRPCHEGGFVRETILNALTCGVRAVIYVGLDRNARHDLGGYYPQFVKRRVAGIGHADEHIWEMKISRAQADACMRRGAIPPLSSDFSS